MNEALMWLGNVSLILDMYLVGNKSKLAWYFCLVGEAAWIVAALRTNLYALAFICSIFFGVGLRNLIKWNREAA